ncbi:Mediator of RNA polymerase II transcription subunit 19 isoform 3 [Theobroma cacao]|uniref:Mediator of RNA polymerase II transcription subunit 19 isoform 3 n=1 Tax=Theobroma cacao TaxID=3641 RepID=A0A061DXW8_THECC|nr:Mediator of RNA polymerase II transcription subunit 19 isoform 3 [Theobroma cacao]
MKDLYQKQKMEAIGNDSPGNLRTTRSANLHPPVSSCGFFSFLVVDEEELLVKFVIDSMDLESNRFGRGPKELGGAVDLIKKFKLWPHHEFFCKRPLPLSISETTYIRNVVGDTEIRKGKGMELDQLFPNASDSRGRNLSIGPFDLDLLGEAFQMRESACVDLPLAEKGIPTMVSKSKAESKDKKRKHRKQKDKEKEKDKNSKEHKHHHKDMTSDRNKNKIRHHDSGPEDLKKPQDKVCKLFPSSF